MLRSELFLVIARLSNDAEVLTATMIRFVEQPRFKMDLTEDGGKRVRLLPACDSQRSKMVTTIFCQGEKNPCASKADRIAEVRPPSPR